MTSVKEMKKKFLCWHNCGGYGPLAVVVTVQYINSKEQKQEDSIPELLILPLLPNDLPLDNPPIDLRPLKYDNLA